MKIAERKISNPPLSSRNGEATVLEYYYYCIGGIKYDTIKFAGASGREVLTLAYTDVPNDMSAEGNYDTQIQNGQFTRYVGVALLNPLDSFSRPEGRDVATKRLMHYLEYGVQKRHKDGRDASHFVLELTPEDIKSKTWKKDAANLVLSNVFFTKKPDYLNEFLDANSLNKEVEYLMERFK